ncbi:Cellulase (glycosyl hydrolase family 5) [Mycolicibacterium neoaurum]|uniref:Beta-xylosidase n=2 Tax=Mycolicibacterium neoaurum TaxID=1795 RepID=A0AAV2WNC7_MYCNE|nr:Beta-xylosidase [Mycolicibacterium neoaurum]SDE44911.1 Cellulase (glycosyl hydrolase family 5) [Mycolicibacterium neoaurum]
MSGFTVRRKRIFPRRKMWRTGAGAIVSALCVTALVSVPTSQRPRQVIAEDVHPLSFSATTVGFADSQIYFYDEPLVAQTVQRWVADGIRLVRIGIPWAGVEAIKGRMDWSRADRVVQAASAAGITIIACITSTPWWAMSVGSLPPHARPSSPEAYGSFTGRVAERYRGKIAAYEVWNEPNGFTGYTPFPDPAGYTALLKAAYPRIKAADPAAVIVGGVLGSGKSWGPLTIDPVTFLDRMYANGAKPFFDALSYHPYSYTMKFSEGMLQPDSPVEQLVRMRRVMLANGDGARKIWVTEYGLPSNRASDAHQADFIADVMSAWQELPYAGPLLLYTTRDLNSGSGNDDERFGIYRSDWTPKSAQRLLRSRPGPRAVYTRFAAHADPTLGEVLSPVYSDAQRIWTQQWTLGTLWETAPGKFISSPTAVSDLARSRNAGMPLTTFKDGYQDFGGWQPMRVWYSPATGAQWASGEFARNWVPALGLATVSERWTYGGTRVDFQNGYMMWVPWVGVKITMARGR